jgi:hypothetical protein
MAVEFTNLWEVSAVSFDEQETIRIPENVPVDLPHVLHGIAQIDRQSLLVSVPQCVVRPPALKHGTEDVLLVCSVNPQEHRDQLSQFRQSCRVTGDINESERNSTRAARMTRVRQR